MVLFRYSVILSLLCTVAQLSATKHARNTRLHTKNVETKALKPAKSDLDADKIEAREFKMLQRCAGSIGLCGATAHLVNLTGHTLIPDPIAISIALGGFAWWYWISGCSARADKSILEFHKKYGGVLSPQDSIVQIES